MGLDQKVAAAIAFAREAFFNDGAEGETVHLLCDTIESRDEQIARLTAERDAAIAQADQLRSASTQILCVWCLTRVPEADILDHISHCEARKDATEADLRATEAENARLRSIHDEQAKALFTANVLIGELRAALANRDARLVKIEELTHCRRFYDNVQIRRIDEVLAGWEAGKIARKMQEGER